jgi:outer membrane protein
MIRKATHWLLLVLLLAPVTALAAENAKIGYVDVQYLIDNSPQAQAASKDLQEQFAPQKQKIDQKRKKLQQIQQKIQKEGMTLSESKRNELEQQAQQLQRDIKRSRKALQEDLNIERNDAFQGVRQSVMSAVEAVAQESGFDVIVGQNALYASDAVNITERVLKRMKASYEGGSE